MQLTDLTSYIKKCNNIYFLIEGIIIKIGCGTASLWKKPQPHKNSKNHFNYYLSALSCVLLFGIAQKEGKKASG